MTCKYCGGRQWIVMGDEVVRCWCVKPTDLTEDNSAAEDGLDVDAKAWARHEIGLD